MVLINAIANGNWDSSSTWSGGTIPGTGDTADIKSFIVTLRDNRTVLAIQATAASGRLIIDPSILAAPITLTFNDAIGSGFLAPTHADGSVMRLLGNATNGITIKSAISNPTNRWTFRWTIDTTGSWNYTTFIDFAISGIGLARNTGFGTESATPSVTVTNLKFISNTTKQDVFFDKRVRAINPIFDNTDYRRVSAESGIPSIDWVYLENSSFINTSVFISLNIDANHSFVASRTHNGVANDYRIHNNNVNNNVNGDSDPINLESADRPLSTENVTLQTFTGVNNGGRFKFTTNWTLNSLTVVSNLGTQPLNVFFTNAYVKAATITLPSTFSSYILTFTGTGHLIQISISNWKLWCGTLNKSVLGDDFALGHTVTLMIGTLTANEDIGHDNLTVKDGAVLKVNSGLIHTIAANKKIQVDVGGDIEWNGALGSVIKLRKGGGAASDKWLLKVERGTLFLNRRTLEKRTNSPITSEQAINNFGIQSIHEPIISYFSTGDRSQFGYMNLENGSTLAWRMLQYNHTTGLWDGPYTFDVTNQAEGDGHKFQSVIHDATGRIHCFYDCHGEPMKHRRSNFTNNDSSVGAGSWTQEVDLGLAYTYPNLARGTDGTLYLACRSGSGQPNQDLIFRKSTTNGDTWTGETVLTDVDGAGVHDSIGASYNFGIRVTGTNTIHLWGNWRNPSNQNWDPWYITSPDGGTTWKKADGTTLTLPITPSTIDKVAGQIQGGNLSHGDVFSDGKPFMLYVREDLTPMQIHFVRWTGTAWTTSVNILGSGIANNTLPFSTSPYASKSTGKCAVDNNDNIYFLYNLASAQPNPTTGAVVGDLYCMLAVSRDKGATWEHSILRKFKGATTVYEPLYVNAKWISEKQEIHIFWAGDPANIDGSISPFSGKDFIHERVTLTTPHEPRQIVATYVDVQDSDAQWSDGGITIWADESIDSGNNSNWRFNNATTALSPVTVLRMN